MPAKPQKKAKPAASGKRSKTTPSKKKTGASGSPSTKKPTASPKAKKSTTAKAKPKSKLSTQSKVQPKSQATPKSKAQAKSTTKAQQKPKAKPQAKEPVKNPAPKTKSTAGKGRKDALRKILVAKRDAISQAIKQQLGQSLTDEQQRRLESAMDSGDQALVDLDREMGISLQEMRNRERQQIEEALVSVEEGNYGICAECEEEISEKRLKALPFARLCVACQTNRELMDKIQRAEQRS